MNFSIPQLTIGEVTIEGIVGLIDVNSQIIAISFKDEDGDYVNTRLEWNWVSAGLKSHLELVLADRDDVDRISTLSVSFNMMKRCLIFSGSDMNGNPFHFDGNDLEQLVKQLLLN